MNQDAIATLDDLRQFVHRTLCEKENLLADQFTTTESRLLRQSRTCGIQFSLEGPRNVRLGAIWASDLNVLFLYDAQGVRYQRIQLRQRFDAA